MPGNSRGQPGKETGGKPDLPVKNPEKNRGNRNRIQRVTKNSRRKLGEKTGKLGGEAGETSISSRRNQEDQEARIKNRSNWKGNRREPWSFREKSGGQEEKQKENQTLKPNLNLTPTLSDLTLHSLQLLPSVQNPRTIPTLPSNQGI